MNYTFQTVNNLLIIRIEGDLIGGFEGQNLFQEINEAIEEGTRRCVVDLSEVRFLNSAGIGILITLLAKFRNRGGDLAIMHPSDQLKKLLIITKLESIFQSVDDPSEAFDKLIVE